MSIDTAERLRLATFRVSLPLWVAAAIYAVLLARNRVYRSTNVGTALVTMCVVLARAGLILSYRGAGQHFLPFGKIHQELAGDRLQQTPFVTEGHPMLRSRQCPRLKQRILHARSLFAHGIE